MSEYSPVPSNIKPSALIPYFCCLMVAGLGWAGLAGLLCWNVRNVVAMRVILDSAREPSPVWVTTLAAPDLGHVTPYT